MGSSSAEIVEKVFIAGYNDGWTHLIEEGHIIFSGFGSHNKIYIKTYKELLNDAILLLTQ
jgi:hypothetical protein